ncbi:CAZyme family AA7 [Penicillium psychrosexuale]|uniref:CAZyme family AA7 n=1 Tax=Penicillium psychrosexuale TaxID=1002107 RepID=UPI002544DFA3|nr:CAZyme family AA7 [Penicillium psychrosexuale]KAJ5783898.1 CAZyme family AA7 [Penicillium psychrosexuale]
MHMQGTMAASPLLFLFGVLSFVYLAAASNISSLVSTLSSSSQIYYPSDADWADTIQRWTAWDEPTFSVAIKPASVADLQSVVKYASKYNIPFLASGGGHGYSTSFGGLQNGLKIDLSLFNSVSIDKTASTMTIGGSVKFSQVMGPLFEAGKEIQTGSCPCVGMVGATLGGGVGRYQGLHGLILDALKSVQLVTAAGDLITVSATQNEDLFWGIRGAGFNYGIVTSATYNVHDLTNEGNVLNADFMFPASLNETYFNILASYGTLPAGLSLYTLVMNYPSVGPVILLNAVYPGAEQEGLDLLAPFLNLTSIQRNITMIKWDAVDDDAGFGLATAFCVNGEKHDMWSLGVRSIDAATHIDYFSKLVQFWEDYPSASGTTWQVEYFPIQAVTAVADDSTAYPHREISAHEMFSFNITDSSLGDKIDDFAIAALESFNATSGFDGDMHIYVSYAHGTEGLDPMYGAEKLPTLLNLKKKWDPKGLFSYNNGLPN